MWQDAPTDQGNSTIRHWLEVTNSPGLWPMPSRPPSPEDVPRASPILLKRIGGGSSHEYSAKCDESLRNMHLGDLTHLSACFFDMDVILQRTSRDLNQFCSRIDTAAELITKNKELPGSDILAALKATSPILTNIINANTSEISGFMEMLSGMRQTMEGNKPSIADDGASFWTPPIDAGAWKIAPSYDDPFMIAEEEQRVPIYETPAWGMALEDETSASCPNEAPLTTSVQSYASSLENHCILKYHNDIQDICSPRIYMPRSTSFSNPESQSRRVVLNNLPADSTAAQVLKSIRCYGGILSISMTNSLCKTNNEQKCALIEFVYPEAAAAITSHFQSQESTFLDNKGTKHQPAAYLIPTPSYFHTEINHYLLDRGCTRALCLPNFPEEAIWQLLCIIGLKHITDAKLSDGNDLTLEFTSLFEADRAERLIRCGHTNIEYNATQNEMRNVPDSSQGTMQDIHGSSGVIQYVDPNTLATTWNRPPYNTSSPKAAHTAEAKAIVQGDTKPTREEVLAEYFSIDPSEVGSYLEDRKSFQDTTYKIIGSNITLTRHKWSWSISAEDHMKLLMANTLHDPEWANDWDEYFASTGAPNLRTWEEYGKLAMHRRECAAQQGLEEGAVPVCTGCEFGCVGLKSVPVAGFIKDFFVFKRPAPEED